MKETLKVEGMTCSCCVGKVEKSVKQLDGISSVEINSDNEEVQVIYNEDSITLDEIKEKIDAVGYKVV